MATISTDDGYLTVLNVFEAQDPDAQKRLLEVMEEIIDTADYPGWVSSTLHASAGAPGTLNLIQWRSAADLQARYEGERFRHETVPLFQELSTSIRLLRAEAVFSQRRAGLDAVELTPGDDVHTVTIVLDVAPENQDELVTTLSRPDEWVRALPGYRSHTIFRGVDGTFVVNYAQWDSKELYDAFHFLPEEERPQQVREGRARARELVTSLASGSYRVVHTRSAP